jgi:pimeloyl-ACP methyl ester carboxylesterase
LHVETRGAGDTILFIQGLGYATWAWTPQLDALEGRARVVAFDNRGAGRSDKPEGPYSIRLLAEDALAVLQKIGSGPAHVVGCSMGGYVALTLALRHPKAVRSLVLISTSAGGDGALDVPDQTLRAWRRAAGASPEEFARQTMPYSFAPGWVDTHPAEFERWLEARLAYPTPPFAWRAQFDASARFLAEGLGAGSIPQPALVIHGTEDRVVPYANAPCLTARLDHADLVTLHGAGHLCWLERSDAVNVLLADFVSDVAEA